MVGIRKPGRVPDRVRGSLEWDGYARAFGIRLRVVREHRGYSQLRLSELAGVSLNRVSSLERGVGNHPPKLGDPGMSMIYRLAKALDVAPVHLLPDVDRPLQPTCVEVGDRSGVERHLLDLLGRVTEDQLGGR